MQGFCIEIAFLAFTKTYTKLWDNLNFEARLFPRKK